MESKRGRQSCGVFELSYRRIGRPRCCECVGPDHIYFACLVISGSAGSFFPGWVVRSLSIRAFTPGFVVMSPSLAALLSRAFCSAVVSGEDPRERPVVRRGTHRVHGGRDRAALRRTARGRRGEGRTTRRKPCLHHRRATARSPPQHPPFFLAHRPGRRARLRLSGHGVRPALLPPRAALPHCPGCVERAGVRVAVPAVERGPSAAAAGACVPLRKCGRCRRTLTVPESVESGFGPVHQSHRGRRAMKALRRLIRAVFAESLADLGVLLRSLDQKPKPRTKR